MNNKKPREIYYDININNFQSTGIDSLPLRFSETRNNPIIKNAGDYSLSIVRFQLDTYSLPTFIADIEPYPNVDANKMIETVTMEFDDHGIIYSTQQLNLTWIPTNQHIPKPNAPVPLQDSTTEYYYGNSFKHYCDILNNAFNQLTTELISLVPGTIIDNLLAPKMIWNNQNLTGELLLQNEFYNSINTSRVNVYFNRPLYAQFTSLPALKNYNGLLGKIYHIYADDDYASKYIDLDLNNDGLPIRFIKTSQEYSTISNWSAVSSIVFTTNTLPIFGTQLSEPLVYSNGKSIMTTIPQNFAQIVSDMSTNDLCYKPNLLYVPSAEYRFIDMFGDNNISTVDINVYWKDVKGNLIPFYLQSGASASIKILFKLK